LSLPPVRERAALTGIFFVFILFVLTHGSTIYHAIEVSYCSIIKLPYENTIRYG
jgi:hypothetical protein